LARDRGAIHGGGVKGGICMSNRLDTSMLAMGTSYLWASFTHWAHKSPKSMLLVKHSNP